MSTDSAGERFHRLRSSTAGVPADRLEAMIHDDELRCGGSRFIALR